MTKMDVDIEDHSSPAMEPMLIILPPFARPPFAVLAIFFIAYLLNIKGTSTLTSITVRKVSAETSAMDSFPREYPAQLLRKGLIYSMILYLQTFAKNQSMHQA